MRINVRRAGLPAIFLSASFLSLLALVSFTSPIKQIGYAIVFFALALIFLVSFGYLLLRLRQGKVQPLNRYRILIIAVFLIISLMFKSAGSLSWLDLTVVLLIIGGLLFYLSRRF